jgi:hypothetical protein
MSCLIPLRRFPSLVAFPNQDQVGLSVLIEVSRSYLISSSENSNGGKHESIADLAALRGKREEC